MTKAVRIENADTSDYRVIVQVWDKGAQGPAEGEFAADQLVREIELNYPTAMTHDVCITSTRYLIIKEVVK